MIPDSDHTCPKCDAVRAQWQTEMRGYKEQIQTMKMIIERLKQDNALLADHREKLVNDLKRALGTE